MHSDETSSSRRAKRGRPGGEDQAPIVYSGFSRTLGLRDLVTSSKVHRLIVHEGLGLEKNKSAKTSKREQAAVPTEFPRVVTCLQLVSYLLLTILTLGPLYGLQKVSLSESSAVRLNLWDLRRGAALVQAEDLLRSLRFDSLQFNLNPVAWYAEEGGGEEASTKNKKSAASSGGRRMPARPGKLSRTAMANKPKKTVNVKGQSKSKNQNPLLAESTQKSKSKKSSAKWVVFDENDGGYANTSQNVYSVLDGFGVDEDSFSAEWFRSSFHTFHSSKEELIREQISQLAEQALAQLAKGVPCEPLICHNRPGFYEGVDSVPKVLLSSFPGSGNTWIRSVIRSGTKKFTGSMYDDNLLHQFQGFKGELLRWDSPQTSVIKTHYPMWKVKGSNPDANERFKAAIVLMRSPFDSILSELNRVHSRQSHTGLASKEYLLGDGMQKADTLSKTYTQFTHFWEGLNAVVGNRKLVLYDGHGTKNYQSTRVREMKDIFSFDIRPMRSGKGMPVLTMFYEDFVRDQVRATAYLFAFLKLQLRDLAPSVYESLICSIGSQQRFEQTKRKRGGEDQVNPFTAQSSAKVRQMCDMLAFTWNEHKWGKCEGRLQRERAVKPASLLKDIKLPQDICES